MSEYWKGIIATVGAILTLVVDYTNLWNQEWLPAILMIATAAGVVLKANTVNGVNVRR